MDKYHETIEEILNARKDPAKKEEYLYLMLESKHGCYETRNMIEDYYERNSPFCIRVNGRNFRKENLDKCREWPMFGDVIFDDIMDDIDLRIDIDNFVKVLSKEAEIELKSSNKEYYNSEEKHLESERYKIKKKTIEKVIGSLKNILNDEEEDDDDYDE